VAVAVEVVVVVVVLVVQVDGDSTEARCCERFCFLLFLHYVFGNILLLISIYH
jgi:hypothetical protein